MENFAIPTSNKPQQDQEIWFSLCKAIAISSGFQRWQQEQNLSDGDDLELQVCRYLKETLETLAY